MDTTAELALAERALTLLRERLPASWKIDLIEQPDVRLLLGTQVQGQQQLLVETSDRFKPGDMDALNGRLGRRLRGVGGTVPILLVANHLSPKSRAALVDENINFVDLSGNVRIALDNSGIFIELAGSNPGPQTPQATTLRGATAGRLIRFLIDVQPPYRVLDIENATKINKGYISRLLDALANEGLIARVPRGPVTDTDWQGLVRRRSRDVSLYQKGATFGFIARSGIEGLVTLIAKSPLSDKLVITGPVAARRLSPVTSPSTLVLYSREQSEIVRDTFELIPADEGADVIILRPSNDLPFELVERQGDLQYAAPSQVAIDCLSGPGRMPAEGQAVLDWMSESEQRWRCHDVNDYLHRANA